MSTEDFGDVSEKLEPSLAIKAKHALKGENFYQTLNWFQKIEYVVYKKLSAWLSELAIVFLLIGLIAIYLGVGPGTILTIINNALLIVNLLLVAGKKIQERRDEEQKQINLALDYAQHKQEKVIIDYLDEILTLIKDKDKETTKF